MHRTEPTDRWLLLASGVLLTLTFLSGGSSAETGVGVLVAELLSLPLLIAAACIAWQRQRLAPARWAVVVALAIGLLPVLQLLPLPESMWQ
ncbi:MAG TPA: hypothetical protein VFN09_03870, partial [Rhodanobacteraceae bacterium]|nr:hypothetical protein [Rhodanobacteraceae bacterium]